LNFLRRLPTYRLLALCAAVVALGLAVVAVAGAVGSDPQPPQPKPLAEAIHDALAAPPVEGVTARVEFKNNLVDANGFEGISPLIAGAKGRLWWSRDDHFRLELQGSSGDAQVMVNGQDWWAYDASSNTVYRGTLPADKADAKQHDQGVPTVAEIEAKLQKAMKDVAVSGPDPGVEAGQPAYSVRVTPKDNGGLLGGAALAWDAVRGTPLRVGVYARGRDAPVLELSATDVQYGPIDPSAFDVQPPPSAKVSNVATGKTEHGNDPAGKETAPKLSEVPFTVVAPDTLAGRPRTDLHAAQLGDNVGAVAVYGQGLDSIVVIERPDAKGSGAAAGKDNGSSHHGGGPQVELPTTDVNGAQARVLDTPLGSAVEWTQGGVSFVVAGSVPRSVAEAAARGVK
jgi:outer membrane lipoprotein-sorting protein